MHAIGELADRIHAYPRRRTYLLPALHEVQDALGWLDGGALQMVGEHLRVPKSEVYGVASSFPDFLLTEPAEHVVRVCVGASCRVAGADELRRRFTSHADELADTFGDHAVVSEVDCLFMCGVGPAVEIDGRLLGRGAFRPMSIPHHAETVLVQDGACTRAVADTTGASGRRVGCAGNCWQAPAISLDGGTTWVPAHGGASWTRPGEQRLLREVGRVDPLDVGSYTALERALQLGSDAVWQLVKDSGLRGRGGAYFPVGAKWETARTTPSGKKFLLVNAEEGEPGIYKDRHLLEGDPHRVLEGVLIAALGIGATDVVVFINGEATLAMERLLIALDNARRLGVVHVPVEVRLGGGGYVLGEETALINAIQGQRAEPLARPPFPAVAGLQACPTVINNVESLTNLPDIVRNGANWFRSVGTPGTPGTKLVSLAGAVRRPGLYEVALGTPLGDIINGSGGGTTDQIVGLLVGGHSGSILPPSVLDTPYDVPSLQAVGGVLGAGGIVLLTSRECPVAAVRESVAYNSRESCGKCTPCREGTVRLLNVFDDLRVGQGSTDSLQVIDGLNDVLAFGSLCGLGQMAPNPVRALLRHFPEAVREHMAGQCAAGVCTARPNGVV